MKINNSMKSIIAKTLLAAVAAVTLSLNVQGQPVKTGLSDTTKKSKMAADKMSADKMKTGKMAKDTGKMSKMADKKMGKDTGKMSKMSKM
jgi:hypothetical protein